MRGSTPAILALALLGLSGCQEPPSYRLRWSIEGRGLPTVEACAESGLFQVRARAYLAPNQVVDEITLPCAAAALEDPEGLVDGSVLPPGTYAIELRGVDRLGEPWDDPSLAPLDPDFIHNGCNAVNDYTECRPTELVCDCVDLTVTEDATVDLPELQLAPPPECVDGIDNDRDGFVDDKDPACTVDFGVAGEGIPVGLTELRLDISFLSQNDNASCASVGVSDVQVRVEGDGDPQVVIDETCSLDRPYLVTLRVPAGSYRFSVVGLQRPQSCDDVDDDCRLAGLDAATCVDRNPACFAADCPERLAQCEAAGLADDACQADNPQCYQSGLLTTAKTFDAEIRATGGSILAAVDFAADDFLTPIVAPMAFDPTFVSARGLEDKDGDGEQIFAARTECQATTTTGVPGDLDVAGLRMTMLNAHGGALDQPVLLDGVPLDGSERACGSSFITAPVSWGGYSLTMDAVSAEGEVCFTNVDAPTPMRPGELLSVPLWRVYDQVTVVDAMGNETTELGVYASCRECESDGDCETVAGEDWACLRGVCQLPCRSDFDCQPPELDDAALAGGPAFACVAIDGRTESYCEPQ